MARILLVEDEDGVRKASKRALSMAGHDVSSAANGQEAIDQNDFTAFDVLVTDLIMPEKEGLETMRMARFKNPDIKVVAISGATPPGDGSLSHYLVLAQRMGAGRVVPKPFELDILIQAVEDLI